MEREMSRLSAQSLLEAGGSFAGGAFLGGAYFGTIGAVVGSVAGFVVAILTATNMVRVSSKASAKRGAFAK
jgi:hypothetical protein